MPAFHRSRMPAALKSMSFSRSSLLSEGAGRMARFVDGTETRFSARAIDHGGAVA
jgi:hypothetical protein